MVRWGLAVLAGAALCMGVTALADAGRGNRGSREREGLLVEGDEHPRLVFGRGDVAAIRRKAATDDGRAILAALDRVLAVEPDGITIGSHAAGRGLLYVVTGDAAEAARAREIVERAMAGVRHADSPPLWDARDYKMIFRTKAAVDVALAYDLCYDAWDEAFRRRVAADLEAKASEFVRGGGRGFNRNAGSNWLGNTRAAGGLLALAVLGDPGTSGDLAKVAGRAERGFFEYLSDALGDGGWCREGFNYLRYPMTTSGFQFLQALGRALGRARGRDAAAGTPAERIMRLYVTQMVPAEGAPYVPFFGLNYPWTGRPDASGFEQQYERTRWRSGDLAMGLGSVGERYRPAVLWTIERVFGREGDGTFDVAKPADAVYALANLATAPKARNPAEVLPLALADDRLGYYVFRNRFRDGDDFVAAIHLNADPRPGLYSFQDAGSFRIAGLGMRWADQASRKDRGWGGGEAPNISRDLENVVRVAGTNGWPGGKRLWASAAEDGSGVVSADLGAAYSSGGPGLRDARPGDVKAVRSFAVDYSGASGAAALFAVVDRLEGGGEKTWVMHTAGRPRVRGNGFVIEGARGATLEAAFVAPAEARIAIEPGEETRAILVRGGEEFFVVMTVQAGAAPKVEAAGEGLGATVRVGGRTMAFDGEKVVLGRWKGARGEARQAAPEPPPRSQGRSRDYLAPKQ